MGKNLSRGEGGVVGSFATDKAPELPRLHFQHAAIGHLVAKDRMADLRVHASKIVFPESAATIFVQENAGCTVDEIGFPNLATIDDIDGHAVCDEWPEFLHEIERKSGASISGLVEKAEKRIQSDGVTDAGQLFGKHTISHREERVDGISWWAAVSFRKMKSPIFAKHGWERFKVKGRRRSFDAHEFLERCGAFCIVAQAGQALDCVFACFPVAHKKHALVVNFSTNDFAGELETRERLREKFVLSKPGIDAGSRQSTKQAEESACWTKVGDIDTPLQKAHAGLGGQLHSAVKINGMNLLDGKFSECLRFCGHHDLPRTKAYRGTGRLHDDDLSLVAGRPGSLEFPGCF